MKKLTSMLLCAAMLVSLAACAGSQPSESDSPELTDTNETQEVTTVEETKPILKDDLGQFDFEGDTFDYLTYERAWLHALIDVEAQTGEVLNDAVYVRNRGLEERFNFKINEINDSNYDTTTRKSILAGADEYDVSSITDRTALTYAQDGLIFSIYDIPHIDLNKPYWNQGLNRSLSIHNKLYFAYGDYNLTIYDYTHVMAFNKTLAENYKFTDIYDSVKNSEWTYDKYGTYAAAVVSDINGDGVMNESDTYGFLSQAKHVLPCFWMAANVQSISKDSNDEPHFELVGDTKFQNVIDKAFTITYDNNSWYKYSGSNNADTVLNDMFIGNQALFFNTTFFYIEALRNMESDFGLIPYPKFDEKQENYFSRVEGGLAPMVPITVKNLDLVGAVLESLACESANSVIPAYYDVAIKGKYTRDEESLEMLDIIFDGMTYDLGDTYWCSQLRDGIFLTMFSKNNREFVSSMTSVEAKINKELQKTIEAFDAIGN